jgi:hypothetical protein
MNTYIKTQFLRLNTNCFHFVFNKKVSKASIKEQLLFLNEFSIISY